MVASIFITLEIFIGFSSILVRRVRHSAEDIDQLLPSEEDLRLRELNIRKALSQPNIRTEKVILLHVGGVLRSVTNPDPG